MSKKTETGWGVPPSTGRVAGEFHAWLEEVKRRPGEWGWREYSTYNSINQAKAKALGFECVNRAVGSFIRLYARWPISVETEEK